MFRKINILLVLLLLLLSVSAVSAADDANTTIMSSDEAISDISIPEDTVLDDVSDDVENQNSEDILSSDEGKLSEGDDSLTYTTHIVNESNYNSYFNSKGELYSSSVNAGDTISIEGSFSNKNFIFRTPVNVVGSNSDLRECVFTLYKSASGSNVSNLNISNKVSYNYGIFLNGASYCVISDCFIRNTGQSSYTICVANNANYNNVTDNHLIAYGITYGHGTRSTAPVLLSGSHYNYLANNLIEADDANAIYLSSYDGGPLNGGLSNYNILFNNTIKYNVLPTSWSYGIQVMGYGNTINSNRIIGAYRGISTQVDSTSSPGNTIINNRIINLTGADFNNPSIESGGDIGISASYNSIVVNNTLENAKVIATGSGISALDNSIVENNTLQVLYKGPGIKPLGSNVIVRNNFISTLSGAGILFNTWAFNLTVSGNNISSESGVGVLIQKVSSKRMPGNITITNNYISTKNTYSIDARDADSNLYWIIEKNSGPKGTGIVATPEGSYDPTKPIYKFNGVTYNITPENYGEYITDSGYLSSIVKDGDILNFSGEFSNKTIFINSAVKITGKNPEFNNVKFKVYCDGVWIENLTIRNDKVENGWGVLVYRVFGATVTNCDIDVYDRNAAYAIYVVESTSVDVINNILSSRGTYLTYTILAHTVEDCKFINNTIFTNGTGNLYINGGEVCVDGNETCLDGSENCLDGNENCLDGNENCLDGNENCLDGNENCLDGNENCVDGTEVCTSGNTLSGNHVLKEVYRTYGILMVYSSNNIVSGNIVNVTSQLNETVSFSNSTNSLVGIDLYYNSHNNTFSDNTVYVSGHDNYIYGMGVLGYYTGHNAPVGQGATYNQFINNRITLVGPYFVEGIVIGDESENTVIRGNKVNIVSNNVSYGINLEMSQKSIIEDNDITLNSDAAYGIELIDSNGNTINNNDLEVFAKQAYGFALSNSQNNSFDSNNVLMSVTGEEIPYNVHDSMGIGNAGMFLKSNSSGNTIKNNNITSLKGYAIVIGDVAINNVISDNYLMSEMGVANSAINASENNSIVDNYAYLATGELSLTSIRYMENGTFEFVTDDANLEGGTVKFSIGGEYVGSATINGGKATLNHDFNGCTPGQYVISAIVSKQDFKTEEYESSLIVENGILNLSVSDVEGAIKRTADFSVVVKNILGNAVAGVGVEFYVVDDGFNVYIGQATTDENGLALLTAEMPQIYDDAPKILVKVKKADNYELIDEYGNLSAYSLIPTQIIISSSVYPGGTLATLKDTNNNPVANKKITLLINNKEYTRTTDSAGKITMPILAKGSYTVYATFADTDPIYYGNKNSLKVTIKPSIKLNKNYSVFYGSTVAYKIRIVGSNGKYVGAGEKVTIKVAGKTYTVKTDKNGYATKNLKLKVGTYTITAEYHKHKVSNKITFKQVLSAKNIAVKQAKTIKFSAKLLDKNGKPFKNKVVTFKINGKKYSAKTNAKGFATALIKDLKPKNYFIYSIYSGCTIKNTISVKK